ncbi:acyl transferase/acyl hydrolase/lysophospholipase [Nemania sp. FL0916]|nr:acyl transferase/acyl hydrolase/lysophospholipase [Nemania sp. FL0916]
MENETVQEIVINEPTSVEAHDGQVTSTVWYRHGPLQDSEIGHITSIQLIADSHDQGYVSHEFDGNWTWFELCIFDNASADSPAVRGGVILTWESHRTDMGSSKFQKYPGKTFGVQHDLLKFLQEGDFIVVRLCARFSGWALFAKSGVLRIEKSSSPVLRSPPDYRSTLDGIIAAHAIISEMQNAAQHRDSSLLLTSLPKSFYLAETFETNDEPPLRVLSLDGGGVRGLASLHLLKAVLKAVKDKQGSEKKPCDVFDMIGGTSTGGLIAIMLGRLKMSVQECIETYEKLMDEVFTGRKWWRYLWSGKFYDEKKLERLIKNVIKDKLSEEGEDALLYHPDHKCKVFVTAVLTRAINNRPPTILRSYVNEAEAEAHPKIKIWEAARATSAAPGFFKPITIGNDEFADGGLGANNPIGSLWTEMLGVFGAARATGCFLSLGTGIDANLALIQPGKIPAFSAMASFAAVATNAELMHSVFRGLIDAYAPLPQTPKYWRLSVYKAVEEWYATIEPGSLDKYFVEGSEETPRDYEPIPKFDDPKGARGRLMEMVNEYLERKDVEMSIEACADALCQNQG